MYINELRYKLRYKSRASVFEYALNENGGETAWEYLNMFLFGYQQGVFEYATRSSTPGWIRMKPEQLLGT